MGLMFGLVHWAVIRGYNPLEALCDPHVSWQLTESRRAVTCRACVLLLEA